MFLEPKYWTDSFYPAPQFDRAGFQARLDKICGLARGESKIRLVFGSEEEEEKESQISDLGLGLGVKRVGRYLTRIDEKRVRIRRWIFEEWQPPEILDMDDKFVMLPGAGGIYVPPNTARLAHKGDFELVYIVADHSRCGCAPNDYSCMGDYRVPNENDLLKFKRMTAAVQHAQIKADPFSPMSAELLSKLQQDADEKMQEVKRIERAQVHSVIEDRAKTRKKISTS